jgi:hypothetical protein
MGLRLRGDAGGRGPAAGMPPTAAGAPAAVLDGTGYPLSLTPDARAFQDPERLS